ncbi:MAG: PAS domain S-box protein [Deltaproteobacteria bacterium]|nr:PAS domain S-box protein [Deltaproteobacteria bacterium]
MSGSTTAGLASFDEQRHQHLVERAPGALLAAAALVAFYNALAVAVKPERLAQVGPFFLLEVILPLVGAWLLRWRALARWAEPVLLVVAVAYTTVATAELSQPSTDAAGLGLALAMTLTGMAIVLPWSPGWQAAAAAYAVVAYPVALASTNSSISADESVAPVVAALLSIVGAAVLDGHRRAFYQREEALAESEEKYRSLTEGTIAGVFVYQDAAMRFLNDAYARMLRYSRAELIGHSTAGLYHPEDESQLRPALADLLAGTRTSFSSLVRACRRDGELVYGRLSMTRMRYQGRPAVLGVIIDVTGEVRQQREAERLAAAVRASETSYRELFESSIDIIIETDAQGHFTDANPAALALTGYGAGDLQRQMHLGQVVAPESMPAVMRLREELLAGQPGQQPHIITIVTADGRRRAIEVESRVIRRPGQSPVFQSIGRDVTERERLQAQTQQMVAFQRALTAVAPTLYGPHELDEQFALITRVGRELFAVSAVYLWFREGDYLVGRGASGPMAHPVLGRRFLFSGPFAITTQALRERRPVYVNRLGESQWRDHPMARLGAQACLSIPLLTDGEPLGALVLIDRDNPERFSEQSTEWGQIFANQAALAIENARLRDSERAEARATAAVLGFAQELHARLGDPNLRPVLAEAAARMLECEVAAIFTARPDSGNFRVAHIHGVSDEYRAGLDGLDFDPLALASFAQQTLQFSAATPPSPLATSLMERAGLAYVLSVPLWREQSLLAVLAFGRRRDQAFSTEQLRLAEAIAYHAATALENARLFDALQAANRLKSDFVATMSHELRSPLNVIMGYVDLLRDAQFGPVSAGQLDMLDRVSQQSRQLLELINATLDLSRLERGEVSVARDEFALGELFAELEAEITPRLRTGGPRVCWAEVDCQPRLHTDRGKLKLIIRNLVDNAVKFTEHGQVSVSAHEIAGGIEICVSDTGRGIPADAMPLIFDMFRQVDASDSRAHGGVGLGLYIVRRLTALLGGRVDVDSEVGVGSTFRVTLPYRAEERSSLGGQPRAQFA